MLPTPFLASWGLALLVLASQEDPLPTADPAVTRAELEYHVRFLASDELGGRDPLTPGMDRAAHYLAKALQAAGVEPAGEDGSYFQDTGLQRYDYTAVPRLVFTDEAGESVEAVYGTDFLLQARGAVRSTEKLPLRFFYDYNHSRMPTEGNPGEALYFSAPRGAKRQILKEKGIDNLLDWGLEIEVMSTFDRAGRPQTSMKPRLVVAGEEPEEGCELVQLRGPLVERFEQRAFTHVQLLVEEQRQPFHDVNVVGRIRGVGNEAAPDAGQEVVVFSAHYDHLGIREAPRNREREDSIFNGADDNASGCAVLLEIAQALAAGPKPVRTVVFLFTTGEESGGRGMHRYISNPAEPIDHTVANLNLEMLGRPDEAVGGKGKLWITAPENTSVAYALRELGIDGVEPDPRPSEGFFMRSDNYALALEGVVAQTISSFGMHREYHTPRDDPDTLDYEHLEAAGQLAFRAADALAQKKIYPFWIGDPPKRLSSPRSEQRSRGSEGFREGRRARGEGHGQDDDGERAEDHEDGNDGDDGDDGGQ